MIFFDKKKQLNICILLKGFILPVLLCSSQYKEYEQIGDTRQAVTIGHHLEIGFGETLNQ